MTNDQADNPRPYNEKAKFICEHLEPDDLHTEHHEGDLKLICQLLEENSEHEFDTYYQQRLIDRLYPQAVEAAKRN